MPDGVALSPFPVSQTPAAYVTFPDGAGGVWAVYQGASAGSGLFASHVNADGSYAPGFNAQGKRIARDGSQVNNLAACNDGIGGAMIIWFGANPKDSLSTGLALRLIHISYEGTFTARDTGIVVSRLATAAACASDGSGGAYVAWEELNGTSNPDIIAQRYDYNCVAVWPASGSPTGRNVCAAVGIQRLRAMHFDGTDGAYVVWADSRTPSTSPLYTSHLSPLGVDGAPWTINGVRITPVTSSIRIVGSAASPSGGLWVAWRDFNVPTQLLGQHVALNAAFLWPAAGSMIASVAPNRAEFIPTPSGDVFVTWGGADIRCSRMDAAGTRLWPETAGRIMVTPTASADNFRAAADGFGGQRLLWSWDNAGQSDLYALHVNGAGVPLAGEPPGGTAVEATLAPEDAVAWFRADEQWPVVAWLDAGVLRVRQLVTGTLGAGSGPLAGGLVLAAPYPNPSRAGETATLRFAAPAGALRLALYDAAGRRVLSRALYSNGGQQSVTLEESAGLAPGVYALRLDGVNRSVTQRLVRLQ
jgi:hypothetical protein